MEGSPHKESLFCFQLVERALRKICEKRYPVCKFGRLSREIKLLLYTVVYIPDMKYYPYDAPDSCN